MVHGRLLKYSLRFSISLSNKYNKKAGKNISSFTDAMMLSGFRILKMHGSFFKNQLQFAQSARGKVGAD
jgi:hypothetical protein